MMQKPKVVISHPSRQHSHQAAYALQKAGMLRTYFTSLWYKPDEFPYKMISFLPLGLQRLLMRKFKKKYFESINKDLIKQIPSYELISQVIKLFSKFRYEKLIYWVNEKFDRRVSERIKDLDFDVFIGYETASLESFKSCKKLGRITILDLAAEYYAFQKKMWDMIDLHPYGGDKNLRNKIEMRKQAEFTITDYIFTPSDYAKKALLDASISGEKIFKIPYGANTDLFRPKQSYRKTGAFKLLYVGSITKRKGIQDLFEAFKGLNLRDAELIMIGGMADGEDVLKKYKGMYRYISFLSQESLVFYYQDADIFVLPSYLDSWAMVVIEAMACGTPVVVSENTGAKDAVREGVDGFIIPIHDVKKLKEKILFFYENRQKLEEFGCNAYQRAKDYSWERYYKNVTDTVIKIANLKLK